MTTQESLAKVAQQLGGGGGGGGGISGANSDSPAPVWVQVSQGVHSLNCALDEQRDKPMDADEVSEHDQLPTLSYLVACLLAQVALLDGLLERVSASSLVSPVVAPVGLPTAGHPPSSQAGMSAVGECTSATSTAATAATA
jgi:hypothetical protein